ncbi:helicase C-terminal domain-containing protein [soil metagenome]
MIAFREDLEPVPLAARVAEIFSETGALSRSRDFEYRREQQAMAIGVAEALVRSRPLVAEAGTGVGKSLAYLVPAALMAAEQKRKAVISTHTINLQEQLIHKDIPIVQKLFPHIVAGGAGGAEGGGLRAVLLKGRQNYVCPNRLDRAMAGAGDLFTSSESEELKAIWNWSQRTADGSLSDLGFSPSMKVWSQVSSEAHVCTAKHCGLTGRCFYQEIRKRVAAAQVVVLNHTLFFTLLSQVEEFGAGRGDFLFQDDFVVLDEAHTLENIAARQLGLNLSQSGLRFQIQRLFNAKTKKGLLLQAKSAKGVRAATTLLDALNHFFADVEMACTFRPPAREFRVRQPGLIQDSLSGALLEVQEQVAEASDRAATEPLKLELQEMGRRMRDARAAVRSFLDQDLDGHVYWVEQTGNERAPALAVCASPVDMASVLEKVLFGKGKTAILTSATLGTGDAGLTYFRKRVGAGQVEPLQIGSPFDYERQMRLFAVRSMPEPSSKDYPEALAKWIPHFLDMSEGRAFVLFTSYRQMVATAEALEPFMSSRGWTLLVQGKGMPRHQLIESFKGDISSVLFGTDSFWTGVDVPGEALSNVIVTRLPFAVPDHPVTAARLELIASQGRNPFMEFSVPEAVLKLRQGIGRLIRSTKDSGIAVILDNRVITKVYGRVFLSALPVKIEVIE